MHSPRRFVALSWLALSMTIAACDSAAPKFTQLKFEGTVTDAATGSPIAGATVSVADFSGSFSLFGRTLQSTVTDSQGRYTLSYPGCVQNPYVGASAADYNFTDQEVSCMEAAQVLNFALNRTP
jgi:protocatechuate 3,4-dioxygenase beta subunit